LTEMLGVAPSTQRLAREDLISWTDKLGDKPAKTVWETIGDLHQVPEKEARALHHQRWNHSTKILRRMGQIEEGAKWSGSQDHYAHTYGRLHRGGFSRTITGYFPYAGCGRFWHPLENRALTLREAARIQGFPDSFGFLEQSKQAALLVGNALDSVFASICYKIVRAGLE
jgi:site-specific DNA-cytosine methylase